MVAVKKGKMCCAFKSTNGSSVYQTLYPVKFIQGLQEDLFSITCELRKGGVLSSDKRKNIIAKTVKKQFLTGDARPKTDGLRKLK